MIRKIDNLLELEWEDGGYRWDDLLRQSEVDYEVFAEEHFGGMNVRDFWIRCK